MTPLPPIFAAVLVLLLSLIDPSEAPFRPPAAREGGFELSAGRARRHGDRLGLEGDPPRLVGWTEPRDWVSWDFVAPRAGDYLVIVEFAAPRGRGGALFEVEVAGQVRQGLVHETGDAERFLPQPLMTPVTLTAGTHRLVLRAREAPNGLVMILRRVRLIEDIGAGDR